MQFSLDRKQRRHKQNQCSASDSMKTRLSEWKAEAEEPTNRKVRNRTLSLVYSSASTCDSDNAVFT